MTDVTNATNAEFEIYEGAPDFSGFQAANNAQDDLREADSEIQTFFGAAASGQNDIHETLRWYRNNETTDEIGFNPDGMCLKVVRTARNIPAMFPSAVSAQNATPARNRITKVREIRRGMVGYYDDPSDSNPFGHVVTFVGRVPEANPDKMSDLLVRTNSVLRGKLVIVRADYFQQHWGDPFVFAATWLNGQNLLLDPPPAPKPKSERLDHAISDLILARDWHLSRGNDRGRRVAAALQRDIDEMKATKKEFGWA